MAKFPRDRVYRKSGLGLWRRLGILLVLAAMVALAWYYSMLTDRRQPVPVVGQKIYAVDGDSFTIGTRKLRLDGIDAPEFNQSCKDADGQDWPCGRTARASLEKLLTSPGLACEAEAHDRYARALATCRSAATPDLAAAQVRDGMAVSDEFNGMRSYGNEEDSARSAKRGIWQGEFIRPADFRGQ
jgi:endonuclease YncB( thermonuclease family)